MSADPPYPTMGPHTYVLPPESQEDVIQRLAPTCICPDDLCLGEDGECAACNEIDPEWNCLRVLALFEAGCASCGEGDPLNECPKSERVCGHHCNHIWENDFCHWCKAGVSYADADLDPATPGLLAEARRAQPTCRLGPTEHDGSRFCHEHAGRVHAGSPMPWQCDQPAASEGSER